MEIAMRAIGRLMTGLVAWLCKMFDVGPDTLPRKRRGTVPPPPTGLAGY
jgi:hypothetical protein